jgi:hypothetical protein
MLPSEDFKSSASANSATAPWYYYSTLSSSEVKGWV